MTKEKQKSNKKKNSGTLSKEEYWKEVLKQEDNLKKDKNESKE